MAMRFMGYTSLGLILALLLVGTWGCASRPAPIAPPGVVLQPGRYLPAVYRDPELAETPKAYVLEPFTVAAARGVEADTFQALFQDELYRAMQANGLKLASRGEPVLSGTVQQVEVRGTTLRFFTGKISAHLVVSGAITRGDKTLFAFQDQVDLNSPVNPGPAAPREAELLLRQAARTAVVHLLNEFLIYWPPPEGR